MHDLESSECTAGITSQLRHHICDGYCLRIQPNHEESTPPNLPKICHHATNQPGACGSEQLIIMWAANLCRQLLGPMQHMKQAGASRLLQAVTCCQRPSHAPSATATNNLHIASMQHAAWHAPKHGLPYGAMWPVLSAAGVPPAAPPLNPGFPLALLRQAILGSIEETNRDSVDTAERITELGTALCDTGHLQASFVAHQHTLAVR
jgi:hypothetical protein